MALPVHNILSHLNFFKVVEMMLLKYGNLMLPAGHILVHSTIGRCPLLQKLCKALFAIDVIDEAVVQFYVPDVKILL